jgi:Ca2+-transporting ATPase
MTARLKKSESGKRSRGKQSTAVRRRTQKTWLNDYLKIGLDEKQIRERQYKFGLNTIERKREIQALSILIEQFKSPLIYILVIAALITFFLGDYVDTGVIGLAVVVNTILGFYQEYKAQRALAALRGLLSPKATVIRNENRQVIDASDVVPGDICIVGLGEHVPADGVVVQADDLAVSESILTGESLPIHKKTVGYLDLKSDDFESIEWIWDGIDRDAKVFAGTTVSSGDGAVLVARTGSNTEIGKIARSLSETEEEPTPLQKRIQKLSNQLALLVGAIALLIFVAGIVVVGEEKLSFLDKFETMFTTAVAIAVAAIPEGLAVSLTVILAIGMQRILKRRALVRKLVAAETLGSVTVICADKTGTLTEGVMQVTKSEFVDNRKGVLAAVLTNDRRDPLEIAMWNWVREQKRQDPQHIAERNTRIDSIPFSPEEKFTAKLYKDEVYVLGAPEVLLSFCSLKGTEKQKWLKKIDSYGIQSLRIVGFATRLRKKGERKLSKKSIRSGLTWLGILVYEDPVRKGVASALKNAKRAGIDVKVITGDYRATAEGVLERLEILTKRSKLAAKHSLIMEGSELENLSADELRGRVSKTVLFARIDPVQKLKIVEALKENDEVVAMTGDGVNDAPALKQADIGLVVSGATDVAKETADLVLMDNNFATIVAAVEEGRGIFENLRKVILYLLSDSFSEVILVIGSILLRLPLPLTASQILWVNLITDGFPNLALTVEPKDSDLMEQKPRDPRVPLLDLEIKLLIFLISLSTGLVTLAAFLWFLRIYGGDVISARTVVFTMLGVDSLIYVFSARSLRKPIWKTKFLSNPWLVLAVIGGFIFQLVALYAPFMQRILHTRPLSSFEWAAVAVEALIVIGIIEGVKLWFLTKRRKHKEWAKVIE